MHKFLRSIGFTDLKKKDMDLLLQQIAERPEVMKVTTDSEGNEFAELTCEYGPGYGIMVRGIYDEGDNFQPEYYFPYLEATKVSTEEYIEIEKHADRESYAGVCDELHLGVTMVFYLQNVADFLAEKRLFKSKNTRRGAKLAALSTEGKIILPIVERDRNKHADDAKRTEHNKLIAQAREGNEEAIESLTMEDMDTYSILSQRIHNEDVLSIVSSTFMPYGIESDQYSIIGDILNVKRTENTLSNEIVYILSVVCNDIQFDVCINENDLMGEPKIGRRFKGNIWLQGSTLS
ncbi:MAG: DUF3881 family protein [Lachnospiraceae bacterium]|nr:DUF3881 family protein [Lachnospiraceae bacterium]